MLMTQFNNYCRMLLRMCLPATANAVPTTFALVSVGFARTFVLAPRHGYIPAPLRGFVHPRLGSVAAMRLPSVARGQASR